MVPYLLYQSLVALLSLLSSIYAAPVGLDPPQPLQKRTTCQLYGRGVLSWQASTVPFVQCSNGTKWYLQSSDGNFVM